MDPQTITWPFIRDLVQDVAIVPEPRLRQTIRDLAAEEHLVAEGAGIAAVAAIAGNQVALNGRRAAAILSGANIDVARLASLLAAEDQSK